MNLDTKNSSPGVRLVTVPDEREGQRIDNFLTGQLKGVPKSLIYRILRTGQVRINGKRAKPDARVSGGDEVRIPPVRVAQAGEEKVAPPALVKRVAQAVIFEDRDFLVIDKPAGVASHGGSGVAFGAIELLRAARPDETLELAHRLDRDTSGNPLLRVEQESKLRPKIYSEQMKLAIPPIPPNVIEPFISAPLVVEANGLGSAARIVATQQDRVFLGNGDLAYVDNADPSKQQAARKSLAYMGLTPGTRIEAKPTSDTPV